MFELSLPVVLQRISLEAKYFYEEEEVIMSQKLTALREWEILKAINDAGELSRETLLKEWGNTAPISHILAFNFNTARRFDLPEGVPPYKRDDATHVDFQGALVHQIKKLANCMVGSTLPKMKKEHIFIEVLESIPPRSADIVLAMKEKAITELYPNITKELVQKVFPQFVK